MSILRFVKYQPLAISVLTLFVVLAFAPWGHAITLVVESGEVETDPQTLLDDDKLVIEGGGTLATTVTAVTSTGNNVAINNDGAISTTNNNADGIFLDGVNNNTVTGNGDISTTGDFADGIFLDGGDNNTVISDGDISTTGEEANGIFLDFGDNNTISNNGDISTTGRTGIGINLFGNNNTFNNNGAISTTNDNGHGISAIGSNITINNNGAISTAGDQARGMFLFIEDSTVNNYGTISTTGGGPGINLEQSANNNTINNFGVISGDNTAGILIDMSDDNTINNFGTISMTGSSVAIAIDGTRNSTINNFGVVSTTGSGAIAMSLRGENTILNNYGGIFATGASKTAILGVSEDETLNLFPGSQIIGIIDLLGERGGDTVNIFSNGAAPSSTLSFLNTEFVNLMGDNMMKTGSVFAAVVDPTGQSVNGAVLGSLTGGIHNVIPKRHSQNFNPPQLASTNLERWPLPSARQSQIWVSGFGSHRSRDEDGRALAYDHDYYGFAGGYETAYRQSRFGLMVGYAHSDVATDTASIDTDSDSFFVGGYGQVRFGRINLDAALLAGYEQHDNDRLVLDNLHGFETAEADFDSFFLSPSATLSSEFKVSEKIALRPSATAIYSVAWYDSYSESGTTLSNLSIDDRTAQALIGRLLMEAAYVFSKGSEVGLYGGGRYRYTMNDDINATLAGTSFRYASVGDDTHFEALVGGNLRVAATNRINVTADVEYAFSGGIETNFSGQLGIEFNF